MTGLFKFLADRAEAEVNRRVRAGARSVALLLAATLFLVAGFIVLMYAAYLLLSMYMAAQYAALIIAGLFLLAGLILLAVMGKSSGPPAGSGGKPSASSRKTDPSEDALEAALRDYVRANSKQATVVALLAGIVVGYSPEIRRSLIKFLERRTDRESEPD